MTTSNHEINDHYLMEDNSNNNESISENKATNHSKYIDNNDNNNINEIAIDNNKSEKLTKDCMAVENHATDNYKAKEPHDDNNHNNVSNHNATSVTVKATEVKRNNDKDLGHKEKQDGRKRLNTVKGNAYGATSYRNRVFMVNVTSDNLKYNDDRSNCISEPSIENSMVDWIGKSREESTKERKHLQAYLCARSIVSGIYGRYDDGHPCEPTSNTVGNSMAGGGGEISEMEVNKNDRQEENKTTTSKAATVSTPAEPMTGGGGSSDMDVDKNDNRIECEKINSKERAVKEIAAALESGNQANIYTSILRAKTEYGEHTTDEAIINEINQMISKKVWHFITKEQYLVLNRDLKNQILPSSLILKAKWNTDNEFTKLKARLIALGHLEWLEKIKLDEIESPTSSLSGLYMVCAIAAKKRLTLKTMDIEGAFLHADVPIGKTTFMRINKSIAEILVKAKPEYEPLLWEDGSMVVQLDKMIYGLKESPYQWYKCIREHIMSEGFISTESDTCIFTKKNNLGEIMYIVLYVDDLLMAGPTEMIEEFESKTEERFGKISASATGSKTFDYLGLKITQQTNGDISLRQPGYIESILEGTNIDSSKSFDTPHYCNFTADTLNDTSGASDKTEYFRRKVMQVMFAAVRTRPDVLFNAVILAGRCASPSNLDIKNLDRLILFLYHTRNEGLVFKAKGSFKLNGSVDASFNCHDNARGHSGFALFPDLEGSAALLWKSMKQIAVTDSSCESELTAIKEAVKHILWCGYLMEELHIKSVFPIEIYQDNTSAISMINKPSANRQGRSKFINRALFKVHEHVEKGEILLIYQKTQDLVADFLTKAKSGTQFHRGRATLMGNSGERDTIDLGDDVNKLAENLNKIDINKIAYLTIFELDSE